MAPTTRGLTEAQRELIIDMDDVAEHVAWEFDAATYDGVSTCGFASITNINGNSSFVRRVMSLADSSYDNVKDNQNGYKIEISGLELSLSHSDYHGCYRLSINNVQEFRPGPEFQRMDVREVLHELMLQRLQYHGYLQDARATSRMD